MKRLINHLHIVLELKGDKYQPAISIVDEDDKKLLNIISNWFLFNVDHDQQ